MSGGAQGAEEALRAMCLSKASSEVVSGIIANAKLKLPASISTVPPQHFPGTEEKLVWPGCGYALKCCVPASSQKDASIHKGLPREAVRQGKLQGEGMNRIGSGRAEDKH